MDYNEYSDKVLGGWIGRVVGSHLGTPMEFRPFPYIMRKYCDHGKKEMNTYVKPIDPNAVNDDEIYQILGLIALEKHGIHISAKDIADEWKTRLYKKQYTAEKTAFQNIKAGIYPPESASETNGNIFYDAIGGQMKGDIWGLLTPNCPNLAAEYAQIDGSVAHQGMGIDGEVFIAAIIANAFSISDIEKLLQKSMQVLPPENEYRNFIEKCFTIYKKNQSWKNARNELIEEWDQIRKKLLHQSKSFLRRLIALRIFHAVHVLPNAGFIALSLLYGQTHEDQFGRPLCLAAMMGYDTDCNCGNIGTIMGTIFGEKKIPPIWKEPLQDQFNTYVKGYEHWKISELSKKICEIGRNIINERCPKQKIIIVQ